MRENTVTGLELKKIVVFRALYLGDLLTAVPSFRALRKSFPKAEITLIGLPWAKEFAQRFNKYFDDFIEFPGYPGLPERAFQPKAFTRFLSKVQKEKFDLAIQMQGSGSVTNRMMELFGAKNMAGFYCEEGYKPQKGFFVPYSKTGHEVERFLNLMESIGVKEDGTDSEFPVLVAEVEEAEKLLEKHNLTERDFVCIHTGSREVARKWSPDSFAKVAEFVYSRGYNIVFTGTEEEREYIHKIAKKVDAPSANLAGCTPLGMLAETLRKSVLLISNDTGTVHVAAAVGAESVIVYTKKGSNLKRWAPLNRKRHSIIKPGKTRQIDRVLMETDLRLRAISAIKKGDDDYARAI